ncbi:MAG: DUF4167 domain-containing protein [Erythrobacter sp.]
MNNNRNNNNRRRGRGNRNSGGGNNNNSLNRIDSRARGNAPQLLDKYKKLAQDAQHHGDRVQAEYHLQFADHYFRVIADNKARQDEARAKRNEERIANGEEPQDEESEDRRPNRGQGRNDRNDRGQERGRGRNDRNDRGGRNENRRDNRDDREDSRQEEGAIASEGESTDAADTAEAEAPKPRRTRAPRKKADGDDAKPARKTRAPRKKPVDDDAGLDVGVLPPAISTDSADEAAE